MTFFLYHLNLGQQRIKAIIIERGFMCLLVFFIKVFVFEIPAECEIGWRKLREKAFLDEWTEHQEMIYGGICCRNQ